MDLMMVSNQRKQTSFMQLYLDEKLLGYTFSLSLPPVREGWK
jgi:hypothetical protein